MTTFRNQTLRRFFVFGYHVLPLVRCKSPIFSRLSAQEQLTPDEWALVAEEAPGEELRSRADRLRHELHPDGVVTYVVDRNVNYTNICFSVCNFCAFYRKPGSPDGYVLSHEDIFRKVEETIELGGSGILMQGGLHPDLPLDYYTTLLRSLKDRYAIHLHCFSPTEIYGLSKTTGMTTTSPARTAGFRPGQPARQRRGFWWTNSGASGTGCGRVA
jgi:cyclic dehypoxanthinyl futalosine synthase